MSAIGVVKYMELMISFFKNFLLLCFELEWNKMGDGHTISYGTSSQNHLKSFLISLILELCLTKREIVVMFTAMSGRPIRGRSKNNAGSGSEASQLASEAVTLQQVLQQQLIMQQQIAQLLQQHATFTPPVEPTPAVVPPPLATP